MGIFTDSTVESCRAAPVDPRTQAELACVQMRETLAEWRKLQAVVQATRAEAQGARAAAALAVAASQKWRVTARLAPFL